MDKPKWKQQETKAKATKIEIALEFINRQNLQQTSTYFRKMIHIFKRL